MDYVSQQRFATTHWSVVLASKDPSSPLGQAALEALCQTYRGPVRAYLFRGRSPEDAEDLTQGFFKHILQNSRLAGVESSKGKFRSWLLVSLNNYLKDCWDHKRAGKRGGGREDLPIEQVPAGQIPENDLTAADIYDRQCAQALLDQARNRLREECNLAKREQWLDLLEDAVFMEVSTGSEGTPRVSYLAIAHRLGVKEGTIKNWVFRARHRFGELLRDEVAQTVSDGSQVDEELRHLIAVVSR